eukprot:CAMPEP_0119117696 /NCGR_PEP_ID=MMETSP1180-20130426/52983_1 /TAXON_ID=3052 ORGANISM="Chlamydomonas cf sp, Strain CCMP681" /NCGR_SAMPLE_ID=MMETSP1180 /ASSEMBLY_ACC=CAM_ASM_000741 /LENGTH=294 /DNA_ID=CAMNT_0007106981 /DNA_START=115 /DNA_END=996 /DNA_ORIENTATION=-
MAKVGLKRQDDDSWCMALWPKILLVVAYLSLNISLNMVLKYTISIYGFKFPIALSMMHQIFSAVVLAPIMPVLADKEQHRATLQKSWPGLLAMAAFFSFNLGCNNLSLLTISLSLNQVIRACIPVAAALGSTILESKPPTRKELIALLVLVSGVGIAVFEGSGTRATLVGCTLCILGTISNGFMMASVGRLMSEKLDVWRLTFYTAPVAVLLLLPFFYLLEAKGLREYQQDESQQTLGYMWLVLLGCVNAVAYNVVHSLVIKLTSSVTTTVIGEAKIILILVLSSVWLGESGIW